MVVWGGGYRCRVRLRFRPVSHSFLVVGSCLVLLIVSSFLLHSVFLEKPFTIGDSNFVAFFYGANGLEIYPHGPVFPPCVWFEAVSDHESSVRGDFPSSVVCKLAQAKAFPWFPIAVNDTSLTAEKGAEIFHFLVGNFPFFGISGYASVWGEEFMGYVVSSCKDTPSVC